MKDIFQNKSKEEPNLKDIHLYQATDRLSNELDTILRPFEREFDSKSEEQDSIEHKFFKLFSSEDTESLKEVSFR